MKPFQTDVIIICPPWGGVDVSEYANKDLDIIMKPSLSKVLKHALKFSKNLIIQMPKTTNISNLIYTLSTC